LLHISKEDNNIGFTICMFGHIQEKHNELFHQKLSSLLASLYCDRQYLEYLCPTEIAYGAQNHATVLPKAGH